MTQSDYVTACCLGKRIVILDGLKDVLRQQKAIGNNLNQIAKRVNSTGNLYAEDVADLQSRYGELWNAVSTILSKMGNL